ncbi:MAG: Structural maintenance of chromosomes protein 3 [Watsoniomyces obsoletus]|nr:MAG: Structural maintenance of chromosomes protein 3 [Watsoniomyces obsoletus]
MVNIKGIEIRVISNGQPLTEYDDPDRESATEDGPLVKYIEAIPDAKFSVQVSIGPEFQYFRSDGVSVRPCIDNLKIRNKFVGSRDRGKVLNLKSVKYHCKQSGLYKEADLAFGTAVVVEGSDSRQEFSPTDVKNLGKISLVLVRARQSRCSSSHHGLKAQDIKGLEVPEKILKGQTVTNVLKMVNEKTIAEPLSNSYSTPIKGHHGRKFHVEIYYRSRRALQLLGCIPRDPSPPVLVEEEDEPQETTPTAAEVGRVSESEPRVQSTPRNENAEEMARLRARLAELEEQEELERLRARVAEIENRQASTRPEQRDSRPVKREPPVKRERTEEGRGGGGGAQKRRKSQQSAPGFVDLTD